MSSWRAVSGAEAEKLERELRREVTPGHPPYGASYRAVARRLDRDDVAFTVTPGSLCIVHLTWGHETDVRWPTFETVTTLPEDDG